MVDEDNDQKLKALESRLKAARKDHDKGSDEEPVSISGAALKLGVELVAGVMVGAFIGYHIDAWLGTNPFGLIVMIFLGFGAGIKNVLGEARKLQDKIDDES